MNASDEAKDLVDNPLPILIVIEPLQQIYELDNIINKMESALKDKKEERDAILEYAVNEQIAEDENYRLDKKLKRFRSINSEKFKSVFPQEYSMICDIERKAIRESLDHIGEKIPITLADKLVKKVSLDVAPGVVSVKETVSYQVVRK